MRPLSRLMLSNGPGSALRFRVDKLPKVIDVPGATATSAKSKAFTLNVQMATSNRRGEHLWRRERQLRARQPASRQDRTESGTRYSQDRTESRAR